MRYYQRVTIGLLLLLVSMFPATSVVLSQEGVPESPAEQLWAETPVLEYEVGLDGLSESSDIASENDEDSTMEFREEDTIALDREFGSETPAFKPPTQWPDDSEFDKLAPPPPGIEPPLGDSDDLKGESENPIQLSAAGWTTIMSEGFEGTFPSGKWRALDANGRTNGEYFWDDDDYWPYSGRWSAWPANGGANALDPKYYYYPNNARSWMIYGPFDLTNATDAELLFTYWNRSETNYDYFGWYASSNGNNFYGQRVSGYSAGWRSINFDLTAVPGLGNLIGDSSVWIAFYFTSDYSVVSDGPFVDNVTLRKYAGVSDPRVTATSAWTTDAQNNTKSTFSAGSQIKYWVNILNNTSGSTSVYTRWTLAGPCGTSTFYAGNLTTPRGNAAWSMSRVTPSACAGNYTFSASVTQNGQTTTKSSSFAITGGSTSGITYRLQDNFYIFRIDTRSSNLSFQTVMANDANSGTDREYVSAMATRYQSRNPVLVFNADYFGNNDVDGSPHHGAEGLIVRNGVRLPNAGTQNGEEWRRSSLSISSTKTIRVGKQTDCYGDLSRACQAQTAKDVCTAWIPNASSYYNTVGGGPLFMAAGERIGGQGSKTPCINECFLQTGYCTDEIKWTAVGVTRDARTMIVVVSDTPRTMDQVAAVLKAEGAWRAIKLDGGGSTQVWYKGAGGSLVGGSRSVSNALMVFSSQ